MNISCNYISIRTEYEGHPCLLRNGYMKIHINVLYEIFSPCYIDRILKLYRSVTRDLTVFILHSLYYIPNNFIISLNLIHKFNITVIAVILYIYYIIVKLLQ